ncbi:NACHT domain-containing protein [Paenarthrobacter histidinolovorans]|uniref:NACHT domain-containing protein n=1 Tax=Paenarthrobacter histidinolovorans TaxID=43664 RepID=UPI001667DD68|nr:hypothetical protein [Paenarthrobacter histidinolovorans]GGJ40674.1 hypothetical protein GCM10010052_42230 [Paenarthrobacter histidinolovorans]
MAEYRFEDLGDDAFQLMVQALLLHLHPDLSVPPIRQPDGGHDAFELQDETGVKVFSYQVKWVRDQRQERDPVKWLKEIIKLEEGNLRKMKERGTEEWLLVTNVPGTAHEDTGRIDRLNSHLLSESKRFGLKMRAWWRNELSRALDSAPTELKFAYPDMLLGADIIRSITHTQFLIERKNRLTQTLRSVASFQRGQDSEVRFKHGELDGVELNNLFIDVPAAPLIHRMGADVRTPGFTTGVGLLTKPGQNLNSVVLGAPGQGKSTLVQFICQVHRAIFLGGKEDPMRAIGSPPLADIPRIPYRVDLRIFARWVAGYDPFAGGDGGSRRDATEPVGVESFIARTLRKDSGGADVTTDDVLFLLDWLPSFVGFDGLDEVAETTNREKVVDEIHAFQERSRAYRGSTRIVVTARPSYASAAEPRDDKFSYFELLPLTNELRNTYLDRWVSSQKLSGQDAMDVRKVFLARSAEPHVSELATNPMQLAILLFLIYRRGESVPTNRTALYASYMELFLDRETSKNDVVKRHRHTVERITAYIGWHLHADAESDGGTGRATRQELIRLVKYRLVDLGVESSLANALFTAVTQRVWVLTSRTGEYFEFEVQPIREYFAAKHLFTTAPAVSRGHGVDRFERMLALMHRPYWLNVTRFMAGMFDDGMISTLADKVEDLFETADRPFWSRRVGKILLEDGVFDAASRPRKRVAEGAFDGVGVVESVARSRPRRPENRSIFGKPSADILTDFLRSCIAQRVDGPLSFKMARVLASISTSSRETLTWWNEQFELTVRDELRNSWFRLLGPLGIARFLAADRAEELIGGTPQASVLLLEAGVSAESGSFVHSEFIKVAVHGETSKPRGNSLAADLFEVCDPLFLLSRGAKTDQVGDGEPDYEDYDRPNFPRQANALGRMKKASGLGQRVQEVLRITAGRRGSTLMWSQLANVLEDEYGPNWLSVRVAISAATQKVLARGIATRAEERNPAAFGGRMASSGLLSELLTGRNDVSWWSLAFRSVASPLEAEAWVLALVTCADDEVILQLLDQATSLVAELPTDSLERIGMAIRGIARTNVQRSPYTVAVAVKALPQLAALMLPLCHLGSLGFDVKAVEIISGDRFLLETYANAYWAVRDQGTPMTEEELGIIAACGPNFHFHAKELEFDEHTAEYVLSEPAVYPTTALVQADRVLSSSSSVIPLKELADREEWFIVPE